MELKFTPQLGNLKNLPKNMKRKPLNLLFINHIIVQHNILERAYHVVFSEERFVATESLFKRCDHHSDLEFEP